MGNGSTKMQKRWILAGLIVAGLAVVAGLSQETDVIAQEAETTDSDSACVRCHSGVTPNIVTDWQISRHGEMGIDCSDCHGSNHDSASNTSVTVPRAWPTASARPPRRWAWRWSTMIM